MDKELLLYNYFSNQLSEAEEQVFNDLLISDADFKAQFDFEKNLKQVIRKNENETLKTRLVGFEKSVAKEATVTKTTSRFRQWSIAASLALLIGLGWFLYNFNSEIDYQELYASNFEEYPNTVYAITRGDESDNSIERKAFVAYESDDNAQAIVHFNDLKKTMNTENVNFYLAQTYLKNGQPEEAIVLFNEIIKENGEFAPQALWYVALSYLKSDRKDDAVNALKDLTVDGRYKKDAAALLLDQLE